ncbi:MAG: hypothetical protein AVDCRST_MAG23-411, partial [uncultured Sphingosinicella sp.]
GADRAGDRPARNGSLRPPPGAERGRRTSAASRGASSASRTSGGRDRPDRPAARQWRRDV